MSGLLSHLKVVELSSVLAGPAVGMFFAEHGAKVVKIENSLSGGDVTRSWKLPSENKDLKISAYFCAVNWGKEHLFLDLTNTSDKDQCIRLISEADVLITNFKSGDDRKFGLSFEGVKQFNSKIIYGAINGFGDKSERIAYDLILQAESGIMSMNGTQDSGPVKLPIAYIDLFAAHHLKEGILLMLQRKERRAVKVEVSLFDAALSSLANQATNWLMANHLPKPMGTKHPNISPYGELFECQDGRLITFGIGSDRQFLNLCSELDVEEIARDERFLSNQNRLANRDELEKLLSSKVKSRNSEDLLVNLIAAKVPAAIIRNVAEALSTDEAKSLLLEEEVDGENTKRMKSSVFTVRS